MPIRDTFPRKQEYTSTTYDKRKVIGFKGYEVIEQKDGSWNLISTPGGHDYNPFATPQEKL